MTDYSNTTSARFMGMFGTTAQTDYPTGVLMGDDVNGTNDNGVGESASTTAGNSYFATTTGGKRHAVIYTLTVVTAGSGTTVDVRIQTTSGNKSMGALPGGTATSYDFGPGMIVHGGFRIDRRGTTTAPLVMVHWGIL